MFSKIVTSLQTSVLMSLGQPWIKEISSWITWFWGTFRGMTDTLKQVDFNTVPSHIWIVVRHWIHVLGWQSLCGLTPFLKGKDTASQVRKRSLFTSKQVGRFQTSCLWNQMVVDTYSIHRVALRRMV